MLTISYYNTNQGVFFQSRETYGVTRINNYADFINDISVEEITNYNGWHRLDSFITKVQKYSAARSELVGFTLIDKSLESKVIPLRLTLEQVQQDWNYDLEKYVWDSYSNIQSLYQPEYQTKPKTLEDVEFKLVCLGNLTISDYNQPEKMIIQYKADASNIIKEVDIKDIVVYSDIEKMLTPEFMLYTRPCELTSKQVYSIVRQYIIQNYNSKECYIDSNYDFCFSVNKIIHTKPYQGNTSVKVRNKWVSKKTTLTQKKVQVFEMTWKGYNGESGYNGYTCIDAWKANSLKELQEKVKDYLEQLINYLNTPTTECEHCKGFGYKTEAIETNQRDF